MGLTRLWKIRVDLDCEGAKAEIHLEGYEAKPCDGDVERVEKAAVELFEAAFGVHGNIGVSSSMRPITTMHAVKR